MARERSWKLERSYSKMEPCDLRGLEPAERGEYLEEVQENVRDQMHREDEPHLQFICDYDLERLLDKHRHTLFSFEDWTQEQIDGVLKLCPQVFVTLLMSSAFTFIRSIRDVFYKRGDTPLSAPLLTDEDLWIKDKAEKESDSDTTSRVQIEFLRKLPYDVKNNFLAKQYEFRPYRIKETEPNVPLFVPQKARLPFKVQDDNIGMGGYGKISQVVVAHKYFVRADRTVFEEDERCALKRIEIKEDFLEEVQTLSILKESWTKHARVLRHHVSFTHGKTFNILLQLAKHGDLENLLHEGYDNSYDIQKYHIDEEFPRYRAYRGQGSKSMADLINQFYSIADAVHFLHGGFRVGEQHVYMIHMDLKPSNILVMEDTATDGSSVGKWMLSDFGISATKFMQSTNARSFIYAIGDDASKYDTHNSDSSWTHARRPEGTYQAPEVRAGGDGAVGKRSDVWSLVCIFSEVLAFGLGGSSYLHRFQEQRKGKHRNDYFYNETSQTLNASPTPPGEAARTFQVRASVVQYLESLVVDHQEEWVNCCVQIVLNSLVCSMQERPDAEHFSEQISHALAHYNNPSANGGESCWVIHRVTTGSSRGTLPTELDLSRSETPPSSSRGRSDFAVRPPPKSSPAMSRRNTDATSPASLTRSRRLFRSLSRKRRQSTDSNSLISQTSSFPKFFGGSPKFVDASICPDAMNAVWMYDSSLYYVVSEFFENSGEPQQQHAIPLSKDIEWKQVDSVDAIVGIRGKPKHSTKQTILIYDVRNPKLPPLQVPETQDFSYLSNIAISRSKLVVLTCGRRLLLYSLRWVCSQSFSYSAHEASRNTTTTGTDKSELTLTALPSLSNHDFKFENLAFSDSCDTIATWCFGSSQSVAISCWRIDADFKVTAHRSFSVHRFSNHIHSLLIVPSFPASSNTNQLEVVVREQDDSFFTTRLSLQRSGTSSSSYALPGKSVSLQSGNIIIAYVLYRNSHLVTLSRPHVKKIYHIAVYPFTADRKVHKEPLEGDGCSAVGKGREAACAMQIVPNATPNNRASNGDEAKRVRIAVLFKDGSSHVHELFI